MDSFDRGSLLPQVGGFDGSTGLMSAEKFDPATQEWRAIASMNTRRSSVGVGVLNGLLYAVIMQNKNPWRKVDQVNIFF